MDYCAAAPGHPWHGPYHDDEYGFPLTDDAGLLERLSLEICQAGLTWLLVLKRREAIRAAFEGFVPERVAAWGAGERARLLADPGMIRNRLKIDGILHNARTVVELRASHGSFDAWLAAHHPLDEKQWVKLLRSRFCFVGDEITREFLMSIGYLPGAHRPDCPVFERIAVLGPKWMTA